ncbi:hypothetical protein [Shimazuella kribbensis]|uniref:hypothetical protein n=1 Tax=Shimazuella kribbensis TaxID=139808 RepID=UPI00042652DA|nr:hypothetical protein [Shimazuella kribbensis]
MAISRDQLVLFLQPELRGALVVLKEGEVIVSRNDKEYNASALTALWDVETNDEASLEETNDEASLEETNEKVSLEDSFKAALQKIRKEMGIPES